MICSIVISREEAKLLGLVHYYPMHLCKHGHISRRETNTGACTECIRIRGKAWRDKNKDKCQEVSHRYYLDNRDTISSKYRGYYLQNRSRLLDKQTTYRNNNLESIAEIQRNYQIKNKDKLKKYLKEYHSKNANRESARSKKWRSENPALVNALSAKRRAERRNSTPPWANFKEILSIYEDSHRLKVTGITFVVDHVIPLRGEMVSGLHVENNLQLIPEDENARKGNKFNPEIYVHLIPDDSPYAYMNTNPN